MTAINFDVALRAAGMTQRQAILDHNTWQLWECVEERPFRQDKTYILYLKPLASWGIAEDVRHAAQSQLGAGAEYFAVVATRSDLARNPNRVSARFGAKSARTVRQLVQESFALRLDVGRHDLALDHVFVDPQIKRSWGAELHRPATAILEEWLVSDEGLSPRVAVLIAPAGVGKTTVAKQLTIDIHKRYSPSHLPLYIGSDQWIRLPAGTSLSMWDVWREAINSMYSATMSSEDFELYLETGLLIPVFDGFDELCTRYGSSFRPTETLDDLIRLLGDSDGRMLITTRDAFWAESIPVSIGDSLRQYLLCPFGSRERDLYLDRRFEGEPQKGSAAHQVLRRLSGSTTSGATDPDRESLTHLPLIVSMAAASVDLENGPPDLSLKKYGDILDVDDPLEGVLLMFGDREQLRQRLSLDARQQIELFTELAYDLGWSFGVTDLELYATTLFSLSESDRDITALRSHALLRDADGSKTFRYGFIADYLIARRLTEYFRDCQQTARILRQCENNARGNSQVIERTTRSLLQLFGMSWVEQLRRAWCKLFPLASPAAKSGLLHLVLKLIEITTASAERLDRTRLLYDVLSTPPDIPLIDLHVEGVVRGLDLSHTTFRGCHFRESGFSGVQFGQSTRFDECIFESGVEISNCDQFALAQFLPSCTIDPASWAEIRAQQTPGNRLTVTREQILAYTRMALQKFQGPIGLSSLAVVNQNRGPIAKSPIGEDVWRALIKNRVIEHHTIAGLGRDSGLNICSGARADVHHFLANTIVGGRVAAAIGELVADLVGS